jgi:prevent-host-death family protein
MKTMTVFEAKNHFSKALRIAAKDVVVVTRRGKPVATIQGIDERDLEDLLLERSEAFWTMIERARKGKSISIDEVRKRLRLPPARRTRGR